MGPSSHCHRKSCTALNQLLVLRSALLPSLPRFAPDSPSDLASFRTLKTTQSSNLDPLSFPLLSVSFVCASSEFPSALRFPRLSPVLASCFLSLILCSDFPLHRAFFQLPASFRFLRSSPRPISISKLPCYHAFTADLSTLSSARGLTSLRYGSLLLEVGFTLRCLQRLSAPYFASLLCRWHDNSCTSGTFTPVLSY